MDLRLLEPGFLFVALLAPLVFFVPRRARDLRHAALRALVIVLLALGLARPVALRAERAPHHVVVLDRSASVRGAARAGAVQRVVQIVESLRSDAQPVLVWIAPDAAAAPGIDLERFERAIRVPSHAGGSPLGAALAAAARAIPPGSRGAVTIASDGLATDGHWGRAAQELTARGIPVHAIALEAPADDLALVGLRALEPLRVGHTARLFVELAGSDARADLVLRDPAGELARAEEVACAGRGAAILEFEPREAGFLSLEVALEDVRGDNAIPENDRLARPFAVQDPLRALYLGERMAGGAQELGRLVGRGFSVEPGDGGALEDCDLVVLDDRPARSLPEERQRELVRAVTDAGVGLFAAGGTASFGPGGYHESPLAAILPVESVQKEEKRDPSTTLVVIIDTSGSMSGNRVQLAKEVARLAMRRLLPHDKVGIVEFYGAKRWAAPIQPASNTIELQRALNRLDAGGGTVILPAIEEAFYALQNVRTRYKHVLVLTDGGVERGAFEPLLRKMADKGMTVSTVLVGADAHSEFLVSIANWGKGRFYSVPNRFNLPEVVLKSPTSARLPAYRPGSHAVRGLGAGGWWDDAEPPALPALAGYVETRSRPGAEVVIEISESRHPVLASWRFGLGRVTAFTTEPTGPGTESWRDWEGYGRLLARVLARTAADAGDPYRFSIERAGELVTVSAERRAHDAGEPWAELSLEDGGASVPLEFRQRAEGLFTARLVHPPEREARVVAGARPAARAPRRLVSPARADVRGEHAVDPARGLDLEALARATGGEYRTLAESAGFVPAAGGGAAPLRLFALWPVLFVLALLAYLTELLYRRRPAARGIA